MEEVRKKLANHVMTGSPMSILGATVMFVLEFGSPLEKVIARAVDETVKSHIETARRGS